MAGLRLRHGGRPHRHAEIRHPRSARFLRRRPALAEALRLRAARHSHAGPGGGAMKFTLEWLKSHLETDASLDEIAAKLTSIGLEVEGITDRAAVYAPFIVAEVRKAEPHPNADKLRVCEVFTGSETLQVVCGAPNARAGMKGIFAPVGSTVPGTQMLLKAATIRGAASNGMLCSEREMGLTDEHTGIIDLPADTPVGAAFADVFGLNDPVIEIKLTPNRGDCLGVRGIARDLAAAGLGTLKPYDFSAIAGKFRSPI